MLREYTVTGFIIGAVAFLFMKQRYRMFQRGPVFYVEDTMHLEDTDVAKTTFFAMDGAMSLFAKNMDAKGSRRFDDDTLNAWASELGTVLQQNTPQSEPEAVAA